jgi:hypothetical protein
MREEIQVERLREREGETHSRLSRLTREAVRTRIRL